MLPLLNLRGPLRVLRALLALLPLSILLSLLIILIQLKLLTPSLSLSKEAGQKANEYSLKKFFGRSLEEQREASIL
jgi:hypothetical protein